MSKKRTNLTIDKRLFAKYLDKVNMSKLLETVLLNIEIIENYPSWDSIVLSMPNGKTKRIPSDGMKEYFEYLKEVCKKE